MSPPRHEDSSLATTLRRKISGRLARHVPFETRRLASSGPLVSFTFDDVPDSAHSRGAAMLEQRGARGVFYVATGLMGRRTKLWLNLGADGVVDLHRKGHEIGLHGREHRAAPWVSANEFRIDLEKNRADLRALDPTLDPQNYAYPFGLTALARKYQLSSLVRSSRGVLPGVNAGAFDPHFLKAVELADERTTREDLESHLDAAVAKSGWLILILHDVGQAHSHYGCSLSFFERALDGIAARGMKIVTVAEALGQTSRSARAIEGGGRATQENLNPIETFAGHAAKRISGALEKSRPWFA